VTALVELGNGNTVEYLVFGKEVGDSGTPHLQGFVKFRERKRLQQVKQLLRNDTVHCEVARHVVQAAEYCKKDGEFQEFGELSTPGKRNDLTEFKEAVKRGVLSISKLREEYSEVVAKFPRFVSDYVDDHTPKPELPMHPLRDWQQTLYHDLILPPNSRTIHFVIDRVGNKGKTWFAHYYCRLHDNAQIILPGRKVDMAFQLRCDIRVLFMDAPRSKQGEFVQYDFLEEVKNGFVSSPKYESRHKQLQPCHVVVLMNESPDMSKLSADRYKLIELDD